eukprot:4878532-Pyramimonas_sp.AAC.1
MAHADRATGICSIQWEPVAKVIVSPSPRGRSGTSPPWPTWAPPVARWTTWSTACSSGPRRRGHPSTLLGDGGLNVRSWNARALNHHRPRVLNRKLAEARRLLGANTILALQEIHAKPIAMKELVRTFGPQHGVAASAPAAGKRGGVAALFPLAA